MSNLEVYLEKQKEQRGIIEVAQEKCNDLSKKCDMYVFF